MLLSSDELAKVLSFVLEEDIDAKGLEDNDVSISDVLKDLPDFEGEILYAD